MKTEKKKSAIYLSPDAEKLLNSIIFIREFSQTRGRSAAIEEAIRFYFGYLSKEKTGNSKPGNADSKIDFLATKNTEELEVLLKISEQLEELKKSIKEQTENEKSNKHKGTVR